MRDSVKIKMRKFRKNNFQGAVGKMERKYDEKNANKERIRNKRENQTEEEKIGEIKALKERMAKLRANQTDEEKEFEKEKDMRRKQKIRSNKSSQITSPLYISRDGIYKFSLLSERSLLKLGIITLATVNEIITHRKKRTSSHLQSSLHIVIHILPIHNTKYCADRHAFFF